MASSIQKIDKAIASINKGSDKKEEMKIMMAPYASWDQFLAPAPLSIALLGQLILVSAESDFSLQDKKNEIRFKLLKYPDSFRACLVQVSNKGWGAFNKAHTNMDQIRLHSGNVDGHVRTAVKFLLQGQPQEIELMLPNALKSIENIADECVILATSVEKEFVDVMELVAELLEACTRAKGQYEEDLKEVEIAIQVAQQNRKSIEQAQKEAEKKREEMMRQMKDAEKDYKEAMESVPSTGDLVGLAATEMLLGVVKSVSNVFTGGLANVLSGGGKKSSQVTGIFKARSDSSDSDSSKRYGAIQNALLLVGKIEIETAKIKKLVTGNKSEGRKGPEWDNIEREARMINKKLENYIKRDIPKTASNKEQLTRICTDGMKICETLLELKISMNKDEEDVEEVMSRAEELSTAAETVSEGLKIALGGNTLENKSPRQAKQEIPQSQDDDGLVKSALQNARFKTESAKQNLKETRAIYEKSCQDVDEKMKQMGEVLAELAGLQPKKIGLETIRKTLIKGMHALGELREQWGKLVKFFQMLSNLVKCCLQSSLKEFVSTSSMQMQLTERGMAMSDTMRDVLFEQAFKANQIAYVVNSISSVYVEVSDKHLMDRITCLGKLIALDPDQDRQEIMMKREELNQGCQEAQEAIKRIANQKKKEIEEAFDKRIGRIEHEVEALMPPMAEAEIKEIQEQVKTAMTVRKAAIEEELDDLV